jgi:hypothetical protein
MESHTNESSARLDERRSVGQTSDRIGRHMDIINKTKRPLIVPLPGGKKLHLGPQATGQITPRAAEHPPLKKLVDGGEVELVSHQSSRGKGGSAPASEIGSAQVKAPNKNLRRSGER